MELFSRTLWEKDKPHDQGKDNCPLCSEEKLMLWESKYWKILHNKFPLLGLQNHLMAIPKRHVINTFDLTLDEISEKIEVEKWMKDFYNDENYFSFIRQSKKGRSLEHIHYQYLPGVLYYEKLEEMLIQQGFPNHDIGKV